MGKVSFWGKCDSCGHQELVALPWLSSPNSRRCSGCKNITTFSAASKPNDDKNIIEELQRQNQKMRASLEFYARPLSWTSYGNEVFELIATTDLDDDNVGGKLARKTIKEIDDEAKTYHGDMTSSVFIWPEAWFEPLPQNKKLFAYREEITKSHKTIFGSGHVNGHQIVWFEDIDTNSINDLKRAPEWDIEQTNLT